MHKYIFKRLLMMVPVPHWHHVYYLMILNMTPGDPALIILGNEATDETVAQLREELGLNDPLLLQYGRYMLGLVRGDLGYSYLNNRAIFPSIMGAVTHHPKPCLSVVAGIGGGCHTAGYHLGHQAVLRFGFRQHGALSHRRFHPQLLAGTDAYFVFLSIFPSFLPVDSITDWSAIFCPPSLGYQRCGQYGAADRSSMLEVIRQDYIRTHGPGRAEKQVLIRHALKNAIMPVITLMGLTLGRNVGGAVVVESIFTLPGTGRLLLEGIRSKDIPMVMGCVVVLSILISIANLLVDIVYGFVDPRLKAEYK